jgi:hypothetical protein
VPHGLTGVKAIAGGDVHSLALVELANQTITFASLSNKTCGDADFGVSVSASSGLPVFFAASRNCSLNGATVHLTGAGTSTITAFAASGPEVHPAPSVSQSFAITKASQTISFGPLPKKTYGAPEFPRQRKGVLRPARVLWGAGEVRRERCNCASDRLGLVHRDGLAAGQRELQRRARRLTDVLDRAGAVQGAEGRR